MKRLWSCIAVAFALIITTAASAQNTCGSCPTGPFVNFRANIPGGSVISGPVSIFVGPGSTPTLSMTMNNASCAFSGFTYTGVESCPFGRFLTAINGVSAPSGFFWELFINGVPANCGLDSCTVAPNDSVLWMIAPFDSESETVTFQHKLYGKLQKQKANK